MMKNMKTSKKKRCFSHTCYVLDKNIFDLDVTGMRKIIIFFRNFCPQKKMFPEEKLISTEHQEPSDFACASVLTQGTPDSTLKPFSFSRIHARLEKPVEFPEFLRGNSGRNFPWWSIYLVQNPDII